jgi:hypothetical protein
LEEILPMSNLTHPDALQPLARTCQIIIGAMIMGVAVFLAIVILVVPTIMAPGLPPGAGGAVAGPVGPQVPLITYTAAALGAMGLVMSYVVPGLFVVSVRRQAARGGWPDATAGKPVLPGEDPLADAPRRLLPLYQTQLLVGAAIIEGMAFFATLAYMLERNKIALAIAGFLLGCLASRFPTADRINRWLERQLDLLRNDYESA